MLVNYGYGFVNRFDLYLAARKSGAVSFSAFKFSGGIYVRYCAKVNASPPASPICSSLNIKLTPKKIRYPLLLIQLLVIIQSFPI